MSERKDSTLAALLEEKPKRGRPRRSVSRKNVYVALTPEQKDQIRGMTKGLPKGLGRADLPDIAIVLLATRLELLRQAVSDRNIEIPEGITDLDSLYLLWDLTLPSNGVEPKWTSVRLSPQQAIDLGRAHGTLNALFGANRSAVFGLSLALLAQFLQKELSDETSSSVDEVTEKIRSIYL